MGARGTTPPIQRYDSGWFAVTTGGTYLKTHNLGRGCLFCLFFAQDSAGSPNLDTVTMVGYFLDSTNDYAASIQAISPTQITVQAGQDYVGWELSALGVITSYTSGHHRVIAAQLFPT